MPPNNAPNTPNAPVTGWTVTSQTPTVQADSTGRIVRGVEIYFTLPSGTSGSVFVAQSQYTPDNVRAAIAHQAYLMDQVDKLSG